VSEDPKRIMIEAVGRLGRETQLHLDERHHHFQITNIVIVAMSLLLLVMAVFNVYYVRILYQDLDGIVVNMESVHTHLKDISGSMESITGKVAGIDHHMLKMDQIKDHTGSLANNMLLIGGNMQDITDEMGMINRDMYLLSGAMDNIDYRFTTMTGAIVVLRENVHQISRPMGMMNPFMP